MPQQLDPFRDFGILPRGTPPPPETVRSFLSTGRIIGQYIASGLVAAFGLGLATLLALTMPFPLNLLACVAALAGFGTFVHLATHNDYRWIELDGNTLRAKHLYTGRVIERSIADIEALATMVYQIQTTETAVIEALLGRVKGIEVRFRDRRTPLRVLRADPAMTNARELIEAIVFRMGQTREIDAEVVDHAGRPIVRYIHWKGERPTPQPGKGLKVSLCCMILLGLMFGPILGIIGVLEHRRLVLGSVPPQVVPLESLIENGPGTNPHVALTDFRFGGHVIETANNVWSSVWIALIPTGKPGQPLLEQREGPKGPNEIKAVVRSGAIKNEGALRQFLLQRQITGLCSDAPGLSGGTVRTELLKANPGASLSSAWEIDDLSNLPTEAAVRGTLLGSTACYVVVIALVIVVLTRRS
jgi:hypothetical protein